MVPVPEGMFGMPGAADDLQVHLDGNPLARDSQLFEQGQDGGAILDLPRLSIDGQLQGPGWIRLGPGTVKPCREGRVRWTSR